MWLDFQGCWSKGGLKWKSRSPRLPESGLSWNTLNFFEINRPTQQKHFLKWSVWPGPRTQGSSLDSEAEPTQVLDCPFCFSTPRWCLPGLCLAEALAQCCSLSSHSWNVTIQSWGRSSVLGFFTEPAWNSGPGLLTAGKSGVLQEYGRLPGPEDEYPQP